MDVHKKIEVAGILLGLDKKINDLDKKINIMMQRINAIGQLVERGQTVSVVNKPAIPSIVPNISGAQIMNMIAMGWNLEQISYVSGYSSDKITTMYNKARGLK